MDSCIHLCLNPHGGVWTASKLTETTHVFGRPCSLWQREEIYDPTEILDCYGRWVLVGLRKLSAVCKKVDMFCECRDVHAALFTPCLLCTLPVNSTRCTVESSASHVVDGDDSAQVVLVIVIAART